MEWLTTPVLMEGWRIVGIMWAVGIAALSIGVMLGKVKQRSEDEQYFWWNRPTRHRNRM